MTVQPKPTPLMTFEVERTAIRADSTPYHML